MKNYDISDFANEIWKDVVGWEGLYQVSSLGRFKSLSREKTIGARGKILMKSFLMKQGQSRGYFYIIFYRNGIIEKHQSHRVVANHFIKNSENKRTVNHINGNKKDNTINNLEWLNDSEQQKHAVKIGLRNKTLGENSNLSKLNETSVKEIRELHKQKIKQNELASIYKINRNTVHNIVNNITWKHI
jgi:DNA-binding transcriptional regulator YiaG